MEVDENLLRYVVEIARIVEVFAPGKRIATTWGGDVSIKIKNSLLL